MRYAILIGSSDHQGFPSTPSPSFIPYLIISGTYSEPCSAMLAVAPGGLISSNKIITTDLLGDDGLERGYVDNSKRNCSVFFFESNLLDVYFFGSFSSLSLPSHLNR